MFYFSQQTIVNAITLLKDNMPSKFVGLLSILRNVNTQTIDTNRTYEVKDSVIGDWLNDIMLLEETELVESKSSLYVRFANGWTDYISESMFPASPRLYALIVFVYKYRAFSDKPTNVELLSLFVRDFHLSIDNINNWFDKSPIQIDFSEHSIKRSELKSVLRLANNTLTFEGTYSVKAKASELSRAPFIQTLYAGMDSMKCLLISRTNLEYLYPSSIKYKETECSRSSQIIYYGAPGTGKSYKIKAQLEGVSKENIFRTTFHPDSDYSTFVGAYKPTMEKPIDKIYAKGELISKLTEMKEGGVTYSPQKFGAKYWQSLKQLNLSDKKDILQACGMSDNYTVEFDKGMAVGEEYLACSNESRIIYSFVPQAFLNAYMQAYKKPDEKIYLIIEEINRGNCAQIFGDLFQLLDRDEDGISEYTIKADADLKSFLEEELGEDNPGIKDGELCLPSNLYIYATMNTSDQSLFPIDSAFKRRWDWEYEPIKYKNTDWKIAIDSTEYSWTSFQRIVNEKILRANSSEDKLLGDYFVNPSDGIITDKVLLNKILFYLWNDVCKDGEGDIFKVSETEDISFSELHGENGAKTLKKMMSYLGVTDSDGNKVTIENNEENTRL